MTVDVICVADRPERLPLLVWSLAAQTHQDWRLLVLDQSVDGDVDRYVCAPAHLEARITVERVGRVGDWGQTAKEAAASRVAGDVLLFPADDAYYVPTALASFVTALENGDLALCGWLYDLFGYAPMPPVPAVGHVDVGGFAVRRDTFLAHGWPVKGQTGDGELVLGLLRDGRARLVTCPGVLYVKN